jgi:hypothetical protein
MKKISLVVAATVIAVASFAQVRFGAQVIGNAGSISTNTDDLENVTNQMKISGGGGLVADFSFGEKFAIRPSLNFLQKNGGIEYKTELLPGKTSTVKTMLNYLELPVQFVYKIPMNNMTAFIGAGPSIGYGVSGKIKVKGWIYEDNEGDETDELIEIAESVDAFKKEADGGAELKRFDLSAHAVAGVEFKSGFYVNAGYMAGLANLAKSSDDKFKTRGIQLTVGFLFPSKQ